MFGLKEGRILMRQGKMDIFGGEILRGLAVSIMGIFEADRKIDERWTLSYTLHRIIHIST